MMNKNVWEHKKEDKKWIKWIDGLAVDKTIEIIL